MGPAGPTTATRMDKFTEMMLSQTGLIGMIGKAERGPVAIEAIKKHQSAYLMAVGGAAYLVAKAIRGAKVVGFADLGMEAIYEFDVKDMPVTVAVDSQGISVHQHRPEGMAGENRQDTGRRGLITLSVTALRGPSAEPAAAAAEAGGGHPAGRRRGCGAHRQQLCAGVPPRRQGCGRGACAASVRWTTSTTSRCCAAT